MQWTPYDVKRLEYQLRVDAASRCPGTGERGLEPPDLEPEREPVVDRITLVQRLVAGIAALRGGRVRAEAS